MRHSLKYILILILILTSLIFSVAPVSAAGITLNTNSASPGTTLSISGNGFAANETPVAILFDGTQVASVTADASGNWSATFVVPTYVGGSGHYVDAGGPTTLANTVADIAFTIVGGITLNKSSGPPGTSVTVTGRGYVASETGITINFDGTSAGASSITVSTAGEWTGTFTIPQAASGGHLVDAFGATTTAANVADQTFTVTPIIVLGKTTGSPGSSVSVTGSGFAANEPGIGITYDGTNVGTTVTANAKGGWTSSFNVPDSPAGSHTIDAYGSTTQAGNVADLTFTSGAGISLNKTNGPPSSSITINGSGFAVSETGIVVTYDGTPVLPNITASATGSWTATLTVPDSAGGNHVIDAHGLTTQAASVSDITFTVTAVLSLNPPGGPPGTTITVTGTGFAPGEKGINLTFDGQAVASNITANSQGGWSAQFTVPASPAGSHTVDANGPTSKAASIPDETFLTGAGMSLGKQSGAPGTSITVNGFGFAANEKNITLNYDGTPVVSNITANAQGAWTANFVVPVSLAGSHNIDAFGTTTKSVSTVSFSVTAGTSVNPASGSIGTKVNLSGSGFIPNTPVKIRFDDQEIGTASTDSTGTLKQTITVPKAQAGTHVIRVFDPQNNEYKVNFDIENSPPPVPRLLSPEDGSRAGFLKDTPIIFKWSVVSDPSGVTYLIQVNNVPDFSQPLLERANITGASYTPSSTDVLGSGDLYWRVKAVDGASNESTWSDPWLIKPAVMSLWMLILIIVVVLAIIAILVYMFAIKRRARMIEAVPVPEAEGFEVTAGQWRTVEPEQLKPKALPFRLALPQGTTKRPATITPEDQARLKVIANFAQSLPLAQPSYDANWLLELIETNMGTPTSPAVQKQLLDGSLSIRYEPAWRRHPLYEEMSVLLKDQPILQSLNGFVDMVNQCATESAALLHDIYRDAVTEIPPDALGNNDWDFVSSVYADCMSWFLGKSLQEPSDRDYVIRTDTENDEATGLLCLCGADSTSFATTLITAPDEEKIKQYRNVHLKLRRQYRTNTRAKQIVGMITQSEVQRSRLQSSFNQFATALG